MLDVEVNDDPEVVNLPELDELAITASEPEAEILKPAGSRSMESP